MTKVKGGVPIRRVPRTPSVVIQAGQRVFHKLPDGTYEPATITLRAVVQNVTNPRYQWGRILNGNFRTYNVTLEAMTITPAHAGVVAVRVEGDNIPGYIQATESISIVEDGAPAVQYKIVVSQLGRVVTSIPCDDQGNPKIYYQATASLYKIIGSKEEPCGDFLCAIAYYKGDSIVKSDISPGYVDNYTFIVEGDCDSVRIGFSDGENVIVETTVPKVCDGSQGIPGSSGYTYRPRGMFTPGDTYVYNDMYRDIVLSWFNSRLHTFRVKVKGSSVTVRPTSSNGDDNWDDASELEFVATDLLLAQNAIVNLLQGNEVRVLDGNGIATAGMSGSGSGDSGIRFYAGSDNPQTAPFRVDENGKFVAVDGEFKGKVTADSGEIGGFSITNSSVGSNKNGDKMVLTRNGLTFKGGSKNVGIGDTLPDSTGASNMVAGVFETKIDTGDIQQTGLSTLYAKTSGGMRGVAISAVTDDRDKDIAISFKGGINTNGIARKGESYGDLGLTGVYTIEKAWHAAANRWAKTSFHFVDGILVRVYFDTPY